MSGDSGNDSGAMSFWDHLEELRWSIFHMLIAVFVCMVATFIAMPFIFDDFILGPTRSDFFLYRWFSSIGGGKFFVFDNPDFAVDIININVASQFMTHISTSFWLALVFAFPFVLYEIWKFIKPALFPNEIKHVRTAFSAGTFMFYLGCAVGYVLVFPFTFRFLTEYRLGSSIENQINLSSYISIFLMLIFVMGLIFEMPLLAWILSKLGILHKEFLKKYRRHAVVLLMVLSAFITPSGDPFTLMVVFIPLYLLYELSIKVVRAKPVDELDLDDD